MRKRIDEDFNNLKSRDINIVETLENNGLSKTYISGVKMDDINKVCKLIIASNPKIIIEKICYRITDNLLVFYASKKLDVSSYKERQKILISKTGKNRVNNYLYTAFMNCGEVGDNEVSLTDISAIYCDKAKDFNQKVKNLKDYINVLLAIKGEYSFCSYVDFNYNSGILTLGFDRVVKFRFRINDNKIEALDKNMDYLNDAIIDFYNLYLADFSFCKTDVRNLLSTNTRFFVNFSMLGFNTFLVGSDNVIFDINFDASLNYFHYLTKSNSEKLISFIEENYISFLDYIYVSIDDLPIWLQKEVLKNKKQMLDNKKAGFLEGVLNFVKRIRELF